MSARAYDEDLDDDEPQPKRSRTQKVVADEDEDGPVTKRSRVENPNKFIDDIASDEDDPDASENDEDDLDDDVEGLIADDAEVESELRESANARRDAQKEARIAQRKRELEDRNINDDAFHQQFDQLRDARESDALLDRLASKYGREPIDEGDHVDENGDELEEEFEEEDYSIPSTSASLPSIKDPKLFLVPCDPGKEEEMCLALMKRFYTFGNSGENQLFIHSAFTTPASKGYLYIEAEKEVHVKRAIRNLRPLKWFRVQLVDITQMVNAVKFYGDAHTVKRFQWVRIKGGIYKGDLAQVMDMSDQNTIITIRMIPRVDVEIEARESRERAAAGRGKRKRAAVVRRPLPSLLSTKDVQDYKGVIVRKADKKLKKHFTFFNGNRYRQGYLYKDVNINRLTLDAQPTQAELNAFHARLNREDDDDDDDDAEAERARENALNQINKTSSGAGSLFSLSDRVIVVAGQFKNLTGRLLSVSKSQATLQPDPNQPISMPVEITLKEIKKYFRLGDHVKIVNGTYKDETGMITHVAKDGSLVIFSDISQREFTVPGADVIESSEISAGRESIGQFELYDMVQLTNDHIGVIVKVEIASFKILTSNGAVHTVRLQEIGNKRNSRFATALDSNGYQVNKDDVVNVISGPYAGMQGTIKHIYRKYLFLYTRSYPENSGVFVVPTKQVVLVGTGRPMFNNMMSGRSPHVTSGDGGRSPHPNRDSKGAMGPPAPRASQLVRNARGIHPLVGKTATITSGPYKSFSGVVRDINDVNATIELQALSKKVQVNVEHVVERVASAGYRSSGADYGRDIVLGNQTPLLGARTPAYEIGSATPYNDLSSMTPAHPGVGGDDVWSARTPRHRQDEENDRVDNEWQEDLAPQTPGVQTPAPFTPSANNNMDDEDEDYYDDRDRGRANGRNVPRTPITPGRAVPRTPNVPITPAISSPPHSPSDSRAPITPHGNRDTESKQSSSSNVRYQFSLNCEVQWEDDDGNAFTGWIIGANKDGSYQVTNGNAALTLDESVLLPIEPKKGDDVCVLSGDHAGKQGKLVGLNHADGIINIDGDIVIHDLNFIAPLKGLN